MNLIFRNAEVADSKEISELLKITWLDTYTGLIPIHVIETISREWHNPESIKKQILNTSVLVSVVVYESNLIGVFNAQMFANKNYYLNQLYIHPDFQGMGIGNLLLELFKNRYNPNSIKLSVEEGNVKAIKFYSNKSFSVQAKAVEKFSQFNLNTIEMIWRKQINNDI